MKTHNIRPELIAVILGVVAFPFLFSRPQTAKVMQVMGNYKIPFISPSQSATTEPVIIQSDHSHELFLAEGVSSPDGPGIGTVSLYNLKYLVTAPVYGKTLEYSNTYSHKDATTMYSIAAIYGRDVQQSVLSGSTLHLSARGRPKSITNGKLTRHGPTYTAVITDGLEVALLDPNNQQIWSQDLSTMLDTTAIREINDYFVTIQPTAPEMVMGPVTSDGQRPTGSGIVLATWRLVHLNGRMHFVFIALDGETGRLRWASIAETLASEFDQPIYFHIPPDSEANVESVLGQMAIPRVHGKQHLALSVELEASAERTQSRLNTILREDAGVDDMTNPDGLLFISPKHVIAANFNSGAYQFGALIHSSALLFARGGVPYVAYVSGENGRFVLNCISASPNSNSFTVAWRRVLRDSSVSFGSGTRRERRRRDRPITSFPRPVGSSKPILVQTTLFDDPKIVVVSPTGFLHAFSINGEQLWNIALENFADPSSVSISAQYISGKPLVAVETGDKLDLIWADQGTVAATLNLPTDEPRSLIFTEVGANNAPSALLVTHSNSLDVYALSGFGNNSASFGFWGRFVLMILAVLLVGVALNAFPPPESKNE